LLSHYQSLDTYDEIIKVILELLKIQYTLLDERKSLAQQKQIEHMFDPEGTALPLASLPFDIDNQYLLVTGDDSDHEFEHFASSQVYLDSKFTRDKVSFNWDRIERFVHKNRIFCILTFTDY
jgi:flagellar biosynthesis regulator FlbT